MELADILQSGGNITLSIKSDDLFKFADVLVEKARHRLEQEIIQDKSEVYYTKDQVAKILNINPSTLWNWSNKGYLMPIKVGGLNRYKKSDINRIIERRK